MPKSIIGWVLIVLGLAIIFWVIFSSYEIFTAKTKVPEIFQTAERGEVLPEGFLTQEEQMQKMIGEQLKGLLPAGFLPELLNLAAWSIFAMILFFGGGKVAEIGIKLLKH